MMNDKVPPPAYPSTMSPNYPGGQPIVSMQEAAIVVPPSMTAGSPTSTNVVMMPPGSSSFNTDSSRMTCPYCRASIKTKVEKDVSCKAWLSCLAIAFCGSPCLCFLGCCLIPCCMDDCMNIKHSCPQCRSFLGERRA